MLSSPRPHLDEGAKEAGREGLAGADGLPGNPPVARGIAATATLRKAFSSAVDVMAANALLVAGLQVAGSRASARHSLRAKNSSQLLE